MTLIPANAGKGAPYPAQCTRDTSHSAQERGLNKKATVKKTCDRQSVPSYQSTGQDTETDPRKHLTDKSLWATDRTNDGAS